MLIDCYTNKELGQIELSDYEIGQSPNQYNRRRISGSTVSFFIKLLQEAQLFKNNEGEPGQLTLASLPFAQNSNFVFGLQTATLIEVKKFRFQRLYIPDT